MRDCAASVVPNNWRILVFGSVSRCEDFIQDCHAGRRASDLDLLVVYPPGEWARALEVRHLLAERIATALGAVADIVLLDDLEECESRFAAATAARELRRPC